MENRYIVSSRGSTHYWISKNNHASDRAIVFLHGLTADHRLFDKQIEHFAPKHTVIAWDAPGHGKSRPYQDFTYRNLVEELKSILDTEGIQQVILIGQSMGGFVSQSFIAKYPEQVKGFVAIDTCPYGTEYYSKTDFFWLKQMEWMSRCFPDRLLRTSMAMMCGTTEYARSHMLEMLQVHTKKELCRLLGVGFAEFIPEVHDLKIPCPVTLILGEKDRTGKISEYNYQWNNKEGYPLHIIKGAAHNANEDAPEEVNAIIEGFLNTRGNEFSMHWQKQDLL